MIHSTGSQGRGVAMQVPVIVLLVLLFSCDGYLFNDKCCWQSFSRKKLINQSLTELMTFSPTHEIAHKVVRLTVSIGQAVEKRWTVVKWPGRWVIGKVANVQSCLMLTDWTETCWQTLEQLLLTVYFCVTNNDKTV